jgi:hypothetical protein
MGAGKSKSVIDDYLEGSLADEYRNSNVSLFKHYTETRCGNYIKSRAYDDKVFPCIMADDNTNFFESGSKYVIIEEFHAFRPNTIEKLIAELGTNGVDVLILSGLKYYANGNIWPTYSTVKESCERYGVNFEEKVMFYGRCGYYGCDKYATKHKLKPENELKLQQGLFVFSQADISEYQFFCDDCFLKVSENRDNSLYLTQYTKEESNH